MSDITRRLRDGACARAGDVNIHDHGGNTVNRTRRGFGILPDFRVTHLAREFDDTVMYLDTDGAVSDIRLAVELSDYVLLNLHIVLHLAIPSRAER
jgi:hypothetical protein